MKEIFKDIIAMEDVQAVMLLSFEGRFIMKEFPSPPKEDPETKEWWPLFINSLEGVREGDLIFERSRIYVRRTEVGYLLVVASVYVPIAMLRLNCDLAVTSIKGLESNKGLRKLIKRKK